MVLFMVPIGFHLKDSYAFPKDAFCKWLNQSRPTNLELDLSTRIQRQLDFTPIWCKFDGIVYDISEG
jgi:hypothetical protein